MTTTTVSNKTELLDAIDRADGGDTIVLENGHYGAVKITADFASNVTIQADNRGGATISGLQLSDASNLTFDGIDFYSGTNGAHGRGIVSIEYGSQNISIVNSELHGKDDDVYYGHYGVYIRGSSNITVKNNSIHDVDCGIVAFGSSGSDLVGNRIDYFGRDAMKFTQFNNSTIQDNVSNGHVFPIGSVHTDFIQFQGNSSGTRIEGNVFLPATRAAVQGVFMGDGTYHDMVVENNLIYTGMLRGISISAGSGNVVTDNTLLNIPDALHPGTLILVPGGTTVTNNIVTAGSGGTFGSNIRLQNTKPGAEFYVDDHFKNGSAGLGVTLKDLTPIAGSLAESKGADALLKALIGGAAPAPSAPGPSAPAPAPSGEIQINAGGPAANGFAADAFYFRGSSHKTNAAIAGTAADALYQTERYGNFKYALDVEDGTYAVTLKMAEIYWGAAGKRVFDVKAEGKVVLDNFDLYREAGGKNVAHDETFTVEVDDGRLDLDFVSLVNNAKVSAIAVDLI
jgi:parallel beta-helix repeat protein